MSWLIRIVVFIAVVAAGAGAAALWVRNEVHQPVQLANTYVEIKRGATLEQALQQLHDQGAIRQPLAVRLYLKFKNVHPIVRAGNYLLPSPSSPLAILQELEKGGNFDKMTIIEGWTRWDIAAAMAKVDTLETDKNAALSLLNDPSLIRDLDPQASSLEGYIYPDTYFLDSHTRAADLIKITVEKFKEVWSGKLKADAKRRNLDLHKAVVIASIIETEAKLKQERPLVASVIYNRLKLGMPLSMDSTIVYASKLAGAWRYDGKVYQSDIDRNSMYNTRKYKGLPPGPVGSPGLDSLRAAIYPAQTDYLFYVRNPDRNDGAHNFYKDANSFEKGVQALRRWEQARNRR